MKKSSKTFQHDRSKPGSVHASAAPFQTPTGHIPTTRTRMKLNPEPGGGANRDASKDTIGKHGHFKGRRGG
jgi:hypothetical protein